MYNVELQASGWTRVDMLLALYDRTLLNLDSVEAAFHCGDHSLLQLKSLEFEKCLMVIHAGLKPDEDEVAFNTARLLHFIHEKFCQHQFEPAKQILSSIRDGFAAIRDQAAELERKGKIPPIENEGRLMVQA